MSINMISQNSGMSNINHTVPITASGAQPPSDPKAIIDKAMSKLIPIFDKYMEMDIKNQTRIRTVLENAVKNETDTQKQAKILEQIQSANPGMLAYRIVDSMLVHAREGIMPAFASGNTKEAMALMEETKILGNIIEKMAADKLNLG